MKIYGFIRSLKVLNEFFALFGKPITFSLFSADIECKIAKVMVTLLQNVL